jgi:accessory gene regulator protein AgrB
MGKALVFTIGIFIGLVICVLIVGLSFGKQRQPADSTKAKESRKYDTKGNQQQKK